MFCGDTPSYHHGRCCPARPRRPRPQAPEAGSASGDLLWWLSGTRTDTAPQDNSPSVQMPLATSTRAELGPTASASAAGGGSKSMEINPPNAGWWAQPGASPDPEEKLVPWQRRDFQAKTFQSAKGLTGTRLGGGSLPDHFRCCIRRVS